MTRSAWHDATVSDFILILLSALVVAALGFGVVAFTIGRDPGLADAEPAAPAEALPVDGPVAAAELEQLRFDVVARGYRMSEVDRALAAATVAVRSLEQRVDELTEQLASARGDTESPGSALDADAPLGAGEQPVSLGKPETSGEPFVAKE